MDAAFKAADLPQLFRNMRRKGSQDLEQVLIDFQGHVFMDRRVSAGIGVHGVDVFHDRADGRIEAVVTVFAEDVFRNLSNGLEFFKAQFFFPFGILLVGGADLFHFLELVDDAPYAVQEAIRASTPWSDQPDRVRAVRQRG